MENMNDRLSIKNLLFSKALPNRMIKIPTYGYKVFTCTDCGDRFLFESSYEQHANRKSVKISYMCRPCGQTKIFYNRCNLLSHIRSHTFKTATINVFDLKVEPLPSKFFKMELLNNKQTSVIYSPKQKEIATKETQSTTFCYECKQPLGCDVPQKDRANHFMLYTNVVYSCPVCLFSLPTVCALKTHMRLHLRYPPYYCPECGVSLQHKNTRYPYNHDCEGFKMIRATARLKCPITDCHLFHPNDYKDHVKENHLKKVFKCPICVVACFSHGTMTKHLQKGHQTNLNALTFYQCEFCPGRLVLQNHVDNHMWGHVNTNIFPDVYPCWVCGERFFETEALITHHVIIHLQENDVSKPALNSLLKENEDRVNPKRIYRVIKRCDQCKRNFTYKCKYDDICILPNECPYKCTSATKQQNSSNDADKQIVCYLCNERISQEWKMIKIHYAEKHKDQRCIDVKLVLTRFDIGNYVKQNKKVTKRTRSRQKHAISAVNMKKLQSDVYESTGSSTPVSNTEDNQFICNKCDHTCEDKESLERHMICHRDPCMAYQCMECGQSFVVKPSFTTHLLLEHGISDVDAYINNKQCYNESALETYNCGDVINEPLSENQCSICREKFLNSDDLEKHFRVHGMAFLKKNTSIKNNNC